jgi:hypothetical protein
MSSEVEKLAEQLLAMLYSRTPADERDEVDAMADRLYTHLRPAPVRGTMNRTGYSVFVRDCIVCGREFESRAATRKSCGDECAKVRRTQQTRVYRTRAAA